VGPFSAVVTTGIYCRPGCGARPKPSNVVRFPLAATAEAAGFRACLQCRPYRTPPALPLGIGSALVCRAVRLILDGALDGQTEKALATELGVSPRHLRRLFTGHLGVTPNGLARSARLHFARMLLDDTDLTVSEIAFAAGFGSTRQLNRACRDVFRLTPRELRTKRRATDRLVADGGLSLRLPSEDPVDWPRLLQELRRRAMPGVEGVKDDTYRRTIVAAGQPGLLELGPGPDDHLVLRLDLPGWTELIHLVAQARRLAGINNSDGADGIGVWDPFELDVRAALGRDPFAPEVTRTMGRIAARWGEPTPRPAIDGLRTTFPTPHILSNAPLEQLKVAATRAAEVRAVAAAADSRQASSSTPVTSMGR